MFVVQVKCPALQSSLFLLCCQNPALPTVVLEIPLTVLCKYKAGYWMYLKKLIQERITGLIVIQYCSVIWNSVKSATWFN